MRKDKVKPKLEVLYTDLEELGIGHFFQSRKFKQFLVAEGMETIWRNIVIKIAHDRSYISPEIDHEYGDNLEGFTKVLNMIDETLNAKFFVLRLINLFILS